MALPLVAGRYRLTKKIMAGDPVRGIPDLWRAEDAGDAYYVKLWKRVGDDSIDIKALWNREVRGLTRLQSYPGASERFVRLQDLSFDQRNYYAILEGGRRLPLSEILKERGRWTWLSNLREVGRRRPIWEGVLRVAEALQLLHRDGTLHRSFTTTAVFVGQEGQGDFRLSGFEWSLRIAGSDGGAAKVGRANNIVAPEFASSGEYSTATDWFDFGLVVAEIFGAPVRTAKKLDAIRKVVADAENLRDAEKNFVLGLLDENAESRTTAGDQIVQEITEIVRDLGVATSAFGRNLVLAVRLTRDSRLARAVQAASSGKAPVDAPAAQLEWIRGDLRGDVRVTARNSPKQQFIVRGERLEYTVRPWRLGSSDTWDVGFCESFEAMPGSRADDQHFGIGDRKLEVLGFPDVSKAIQPIRARAVPWSRMFSFAKQKAELDPHLKDVLDFFRITQQLDTILTAAQICPVQVVEVSRTHTHTVAVVTPQEDPARNDLAALLNLPGPAEQFRDWLEVGAEWTGDEDESEPSHDTYELLERPVLDRSGSSRTWRYTEGHSDPNGPRYTFRCLGVPSIKEGDFYFLARNHGGTIAQIRRRHRAIQGMQAHEDLLRLLADPFGSSRKTGDVLPSGRLDIPLDASKTHALKQLWQTQPSFAVQGPPGTGKTTLIKAFADRLFSADPSAQILLTAHSHHTVDDVRSKLDLLFIDLPLRERPVLVRLGSKEPTQHDTRPVTEDIVLRLKSSSIAKRMPQNLQDILAHMVPGNSNHDEAAKAEFRAMEVLVQDAANITFSTLNSSELADSSERGRRFDWSIIEEAGKAHGFDMSLALGQSHRLLLIGDHFQLPPFNSKVFKKLLGDPLRVSKAVASGERFAPTLVDASIVREEEGRETFADRCDRWMRMVDIFGRFFRSSMGEDQGGAGPAATLTDQHRMHPTIASLVGEVFYPGVDGGTILVSPPETYRHFSGVPPFLIRSGSWLPQERIVWCNVPWQQKDKFASGEKNGVFASPAEVQVVLKVLSELLPREGKPCEIQVLSPYNDQLAAIREAVHDARKQGALSPMFGTTFDMSLGKRLGATVDEFQGSEADIVIVSLVRNNPLPPWASVGFLNEANRMNVLLSRARHKLVIVGSWAFFRSRVDQDTPADAEYAYIGKMMDHLEAGVVAGTVKIVDPL